MFMLLFALVPAIFAPLFYILHRNAERFERKDLDGEKYKGVFMVPVVLLLMITVIFSASGVVGTLVTYANQLSDAENLVKYANLERIYENRATVLTNEFKAYLSKQYPTHEKEIFKSIGPGNIDIYLAKYPEIRSSKTLVELVGQIRSMQDDKYDQQIMREKVLKMMRYRTVNPWIFNGFIPPVPQKAGQ